MTKNYKIVMKLKSLFTTALFTFIISAAVALPPSGVGGNENADDPDNEVPIDGGIGFLLLAGAAYGAKKVLKK